MKNHSWHLAFIGLGIAVALLFGWKIYLAFVIGGFIGITFRRFL